MIKSHLVFLIFFGLSVLSSRKIFAQTGRVFTQDSSLDVTGNYNSLSNFYYVTPPAYTPNITEIKILQNQFYCYLGLGSKAIYTHLDDHQVVWKPHFVDQNNLGTGCRWDNWGLKFNLTQGWDSFHSNDPALKNPDRLYIATNQANIDYNLWLYQNTYGLYLGLGAASVNLKTWKIQDSSSSTTYQEDRVIPIISLTFAGYFSGNVMVEFTAERSMDSKEYYWSYAVSLGFFGRFAKDFLSPKRLEF